MEIVRRMKFELFVWTEIKLLAPAVQKVDSAIHWINHYQVDNEIDLVTTPSWQVGKRVRNYSVCMNNKQQQQQYLYSPGT